MRSDSKMRGIRQRLHPFSHCRAVPPHRTVSGADDDWFAGDGSQEAPIDFPALYQKYLFTVVYIGRTQIHPHNPLFFFQMLVGGGRWYPRDNSPCSMTRQTTCNIISKNESIGSATKRILIGYNEAWVWLWALSGAPAADSIVSISPAECFFFFFFTHTQCRPATTAGTEQTSRQWISQMVNPHTFLSPVCTLYIYIFFWFMIWELPRAWLFFFFFLFSNQTYSSTACLFWRCYRCHMVII